MVLVFGVQSPIGALAGLTRRSWFAPKGLVERKIVADGILKARKDKRKVHLHVVLLLEPVFLFSNIDK